ncbi:mechanosensitive ion channel family protein [Sphingomonas sp.]|uniref:mechanosensitive ion channel family protein n=1 Tax=Sphingomonas sp. TaxID=28214 RepID=UPI003B00DD0B
MAAGTNDAATNAAADAAARAVKAHALHVQSRRLVAQTVEWLRENSTQVAVASGAGVLIFLALLAVTKFGARLVGEASAITNLRSIIGRVCQKTGYLFLFILSVKIVLGFADAPLLLRHFVSFVFTIGMTIQSAVWVREIVLGYVEYRAGLTDHDHSALGSALGIIRLLVTLTVFSLATVIVLDNLGVNVTGLVAGLGIGGIAIGLAAQGIFKDLFAALAIIFDRPFRKGDSVKWNNISGTVEAIGLKTTRIRALTGEQVIVGNSNLLEKEMFNLARLDRRRITLALGLVYNTPEDVADQVPALLTDITEGVARCQVVRVGMIGFGTSSLDFELQFDVRSANYNDVFEARSKVCLAILRRFNALGIEFAFPTQVTMTAGPDGRAVMPYPDVAFVAQPHARAGDESAEEMAP